MPVTRKIFTFFEVKSILARRCKTTPDKVFVYNNDQLELNDHTDNRIIVDENDIFLFQVDL